ncbi:MAG: hypothetical protein U5K74_10825 [Gemmatimonadaceae bacterium]|nr:hypothetical protein [Gemmatimonadaceae bacterium]
MPSLLCASALTAQGAPAARYRVSSTAVISLDRMPQAPLVDTITTTSLVAIEISAGIDTVATLTLDSLQVLSTGMIRRAPDAFSRGISVSALLINGRPRITGDSASACTAERPLAGLLPELVPLLPTPLRADQQWSDTLSVTTCRAGLPVTTTTIVAYRTMTGMDSSTVLLERRAVTQAMGSALLRSQTVTLTGTGTGESLAVIAVATRQLQSWRGTQSLEIQLTNGQQTRRMVQQLTDSATLIVP